MIFFLVNHLIKGGHCPNYPQSPIILNSWWAPKSQNNFQSWFSWQDPYIPLSSLIDFSPMHRILFAVKCNGEATSIPIPFVCILILIWKEKSWLFIFVKAKRQIITSASNHCPLLFQLALLLLPSAPTPLHQIGIFAGKSTGNRNDGLFLKIRFRNFQFIAFCENSSFFLIFLCFVLLAIRSELI